MISEIFQQRLQAVDLARDPTPDVGVAYKESVFARFEYGHLGMNVAARFDRLFHGVERFVRAQFQTVRIVDERIACDARLFVVRLAETAVDDDQFPLRLDGALAVLFLDGNVTVDDMAVFSVNAEIAQYFFAERLVVAVAVIGVALFLMVFSSSM